MTRDTVIFEPNRLDTRTLRKPMGELETFSASLFGPYETGSTIVPWLLENGVHVALACRAVCELLRRSSTRFHKHDCLL